MQGSAKYLLVQKCTVSVYSTVERVRGSLTLLMRPDADCRKYVAWGFVSWWTAVACQRGVSETVCVKGWRVRPRSSSWRDGRLQPRLQKGWALSEIYNHLHCLKSVELQVVLAAPFYQMVHLPLVGGHIPTRDCGVIHKPQELDDWWVEVQRLVCREKSRRDRTQPLGELVLMVRESDMFYQLHMLPPVRQEVWSTCRWSQVHSARRACPTELEW